MDRKRGRENIPESGPGSVDGNWGVSKGRERVERDQVGSGRGSGGNGSHMYNNTHTMNPNNKLQNSKNNFNENQNMQQNSARGGYYGGTGTGSWQGAQLR